jgi:hypothetical protein
MRRKMMKPNEEKSGKKSYHAPELRDYGNITVITSNSRGTHGNDGATRGNSRTG